jgi:hypothetical protein
MIRISVCLLFPAVFWAGLDGCCRRRQIPQGRAGVRSLLGQLLETKTETRMTNGIGVGLGGGHGHFSRLAFDRYRGSGAAEATWRLSFLSSFSVVFGPSLLCSSSGRRTSTVPKRRRNRVSVFGKNPPFSHGKTFRRRSLLSLRFLPSVTRLPCTRSLALGSPDRLVPPLPLRSRSAICFSLPARWLMLRWPAFPCFLAHCPAHASCLLLRFAGRPWLVSLQKNEC